jgi:hypothetical protein
MFLAKLDGFNTKMEDTYTQSEELCLSLKTQLVAQSKVASDKDHQRQLEIQEVSKRMRVITTELDDFKKSIEPNIMIMSGRLEQVETKAVDLWHSVEDLNKKTGGASGSIEE